MYRPTNEDDLVSSVGRRINGKRYVDPKSLCAPVRHQVWRSKMFQRISVLAGIYSSNVSSFPSLQATPQVNWPYFLGLCGLWSSSLVLSGMSLHICLLRAMKIMLPENHTCGGSKDNLVQANRNMAGEMESPLGVISYRICAALVAECECVCLWSRSWDQTGLDLRKGGQGCKTNREG